MKASGTIPGIGSGQSGSHSGGYGEDQGTPCAQVDICPDLLFGAIFAAGAAAFFLLYMEITKKGARKKRDTTDIFSNIIDKNGKFNLICKHIILITEKLL